MRYDADSEQNDADDLQFRRVRDRWMAVSREGWFLIVPIHHRWDAMFIPGPGGNLEHAAADVASFDAACTWCAAHAELLSGFRDAIDVSAHAGSPE